VLEPEAHVGPTERILGEHRTDRCELGLRRGEGLPAGRRVVEEVAHLDGRADVPARDARFPLATAVDRDLRPADAAGLGSERQPAHRRDARECLASEAERCDAADVFGLADLARGVALDGQQGVFAVHPTAVIGHRYPLFPALLDGDPHARRTGVEAVFDQLLEDACRSGDYLPGRDALDRVPIEPRDRRGSWFRVGTPVGGLGATRFRFGRSRLARRIRHRVDL
jgi:hypothetical protein